MRHLIRRSSALLLLGGGALALQACSKQATGQVAAVVNGDEITLQQINAEIGNAKIPDGAEKEKARVAVLQRMVDKSLLEQQAKAGGIDRDPDYLVKQRQLSQALLIQLYAKRTQDTLKVPDEATIAKFMADHPGSFGNRMVFTVDQIRFALTRDAAVLQGLKAAHSLDAVAAVLKGANVQFARGTAKIDSAQVPEAMLKQVFALPAGEPFVVPTPQGVVASVVTSTQPVPQVEEQAKPLAVQMIRQQQLDTVIQQRLKDARAQAKITYQPGYGPSAAVGVGAK